MRNTRRILGPIPSQAIATARGNARNRLLSGNPRSLTISLLALASAFLFMLAFYPILNTDNWFNRLLYELRGPSREFEPAIVIGFYLFWGCAGYLFAYATVAFFRPDALPVFRSSAQGCVLFLRPFRRKPARKIELAALLVRSSFVGSSLRSASRQEFVPRLGALRTYASNDAWQQVIQEFLRASDTIVVMAGTKAACCGSCRR